MYNPPPFKVTDLAIIHAFVRKNSFAVLTTTDTANLPIAVHVPMQLSQDATTLNFHVSRGNPIARSFQEGRPCLVVFSGPHAYISPRWYDHANVPTWNYLAVHASGIPRVVNDAAEVLTLLRELTETYESAEFSSALFDGADLADIAGSMRGIVTVKLSITGLEGSFKLSQNRNEVSFRSIISELEKRGDAESVAIAQAMRENSPY